MLNIFTFLIVSSLLFKFSSILILTNLETWYLEDVILF